AGVGERDGSGGGRRGGKGNLKQCVFWEEGVGPGDKGLARPHVDGGSEAAAGSRDGEGGDGRLWQHEVQLTWEGLIELRQNRMTRLLLLARGSEQLRWGNQVPEVQ